MSSISADHEENVQGSYFIDHESTAEMARLLVLDRLLTRGMRGTLAERQDVASIRTVLDLACGPGGWVLDLATAHPEMEVYGVDISRQMVEYATTTACSRGLGNAHFIEMDVTKPLDFFSDSSFDLINVRYLTGFLIASRWSDVFLECKRLLRLGGTLRVTETEMGGVSTSPALERMVIWAIQALGKVNHSFSPDSRRMATITVLPSIFSAAGYVSVESMSHLINFSVGSEAHEGFCENWRVFYKLLQPFLVTTGVATQEEIDDTYTRMLAEMQDPSFLACYDLHTFWGSKPV